MIGGEVDSGTSMLLSKKEVRCEERGSASGLRGVIQAAFADGPSNSMLCEVGDASEFDRDSLYDGLRGGNSKDTRGVRSFVDSVSLLLLLFEPCHSLLLSILGSIVGSVAGGVGRLLALRSLPFLELVAFSERGVGAFERCISAIPLYSSANSCAHA